MIYKLSNNKVPKLSEVGGKAKALIEMKSAGFPVPKGIVLSTVFFNGWVRMLKENEAWNVFLEEPSRENCDVLKNMASNFKLTDDQRSELSKGMEHFSKEDIFAVRSSSPEEDLEEASFAGEYETTLGVTYDNIESAIVNSFISMLDFRVVEYKKKHGIDIDKPNVAIIIQKQIPSVVSGVGFSINPKTGAKDEAMINSNFGLGETVVSGQVTPDIYIVKNRKIISKKIANKHVALYLKEGGLTEERTIENPNDESLTNEQVLKLGELINKVADYYKKPMDIEWAIAEGKIYLLQARMVTTDLTEINWDIGPHPKGTIFARGSIVELMPDPLSPLYEDYTNKHVPSTVVKMIEEIMPGGGAILGTMEFTSFNGYGYYKFKMDRRIYWVFIKNLKKLLKLIKTHPDWVENEKLPKIKERLKVLKELDLKEVTTKELYDMSHELTETICTYYTYCQIYLAQAYTSEGLFIKYYDRKIKPKIGASSYVFMIGDDNAPILADKALYELAQEIKKDEKTKDYILNNSSEEIKKFLFSKNFEEHPVLNGFKEYLAVHGHMVYDLDFLKPTPSDDPRPIIEVLKLYISGKGANPIQRQNEALKKREELEQKVKELVSESTYKKFVKKLNYARFFAPYRENGLANAGICQPLLRKILFEIGRRIEKEGYIKSYEDVFWLKEKELENFIKHNHLDSLMEEIPKRKILWKKQKTVNPPTLLPKNFRILGIKLNAFLPADLDEHTGDNVYEGIGASAGKVTGKARVILSPEEFELMKQGEILITAMTTPAWTTLFALASGIVTDFGGPLSHSSIVAREYGIPAVLGTGGLSRIIKTGQTVTVDADRGVVIIED